ncbi:MAG: class I SAM-dependent methyltransferase [Acidobacteriota bacterium]
MGQVDESSGWIHYDRCKLCGSPDLRPLYDLFDTRPVTVVRCIQCGFQFQNPVPPESDSHYRSPLTTEKLHATWDAQEGLFRERLKRIVRYDPRLAHMAGLRVLDVGAGPAVFLRICRDRGAEVLGVEFGVADAVRREYGIEIIEKPVEDPWWGATHARSFDLITMFDVLEHVYDPVTTLENIVPLLRPGGTIFVSTPCRDSVVELAGWLLYRSTGGRVRHLLNARYNRHHVHIFSTRELADLMVGSGLESVRTEALADYSCSTWLYLYKFLVRNRTVAHLLGKVLTPLLRLAPLTNKGFAYGKTPIEEG